MQTCRHRDAELLALFLTLHLKQNNEWYRLA